MRDQIIACQDFDGDKESESLGIVFVDDKSRSYNFPNEIGKNLDSPEAPFAGMSLYRCSVLLQRVLRANVTNPENEVRDDMFAIFDERSLVDGTLLLVDPPEPEEENPPLSCSVRIFPQLMQMRLALWTAGSSSIWEDEGRAQITSGVCSHTAISESQHNTSRQQWIG